MRPITKAHLHRPLAQQLQAQLRQAQPHLAQRPQAQLQLELHKLVLQQQELYLLLPNLLVILALGLQLNKIITESQLKMNIFT